MTRKISLKKLRQLSLNQNSTVNLVAPLGKKLSQRKRNSKLQFAYKTQLLEEFYLAKPQHNASYNGFDRFRTGEIVAPAIANHPHPARLGTTQLLTPLRGAIPFLSNSTFLNTILPYTQVKNVLRKKEQLRTCSYFQTVLQQRKRLQYLYGNVSKTQIEDAIAQALHLTGAKGENLFKVLESRLEIVVWRAGFAATVSSARQMIGCGRIQVNNKVTVWPGKMLVPGDIIGVKDVQCETQFDSRSKQNSSTPPRQTAQLTKPSLVGLAWSLAAAELVTIPFCTRKTRFAAYAPQKEACWRFAISPLLFAELDLLMQQNGSQPANLKRVDSQVTEFASQSSLPKTMLGTDRKPHQLSTHKNAQSHTGNFQERSRNSFQDSVRAHKKTIARIIVFLHKKLLGAAPYNLAFTFSQDRSRPEKYVKTWSRSVTTHMLLICLVLCLKKEAVAAIPKSLCVRAQSRNNFFKSQNQALVLISSLISESNQLQHTKIRFFNYSLSRTKAQVAGAKRTFAPTRRSMHDTVQKSAYRELENIVKTGNSSVLAQKTSKPLHLEISYQSLHAIFLYPPQRICSSASIDFDCIMQFYSV